MATHGGIQRWFRILVLGLIVGGLCVPVAQWWTKNQTQLLAAQCRKAVAAEHWGLIKAALKIAIKRVERAGLNPDIQLFAAGGIAAAV